MFGWSVDRRYMPNELMKCPVGCDPVRATLWKPTPGRYALFNLRFDTVHREIWISVLTGSEPFPS